MESPMCHPDHEYYLLQTHGKHKEHQKQEDSGYFGNSSACSSALFSGDHCPSGSLNGSCTFEVAEGYWSSTPLDSKHCAISSNHKRPKLTYKRKLIDTPLLLKNDPFETPASFNPHKIFSNNCSKPSLQVGEWTFENDIDNSFSSWNGSHNMDFSPDVLQCKLNSGVRNLHFEEMEDDDATVPEKVNSICIEMEEQLSDDSETLELKPDIPETVISEINIKKAKNICSDSLVTRKTSEHKMHPFLQMMVPIPGTKCETIHIDFLVELSQRVNCTQILSHIFSYLSAKDLCNISWVCRKWRKLCHHDKKIYSMCTKYLNENRKISLAIGKENWYCKQKAALQSHHYGPLGCVTNLDNAENNTDQSCDCESPKSQYDCFVEEAQKVKSGDKLHHCPRCMFPAHISTSENRGLCTKVECGYNFCVSCFGPHSGSECSLPQNETPTKKNRVISTRKNRKNLRRL